MKIPDKVIELFNKTDLISFGTANSNGIPNIVAIYWKKIINEDTIIFIDNFMKMTKENIKENKNVCISFWDSKTEEGYKLKGIATHYTEGEIYNKGKEFIQSKKPDRVPKGVVEIKIKEIFEITPGSNAGNKICS